MSKLHKGKTISKEMRKKLSKINSGRNNNMFGKISHSKGKYYGKIWMRSSWEIAYAKWLDKQNIKWLYEPKAFDLGESTYRPDFYLPEIDTYIEIKGYWRDDAKKKFILCNKLYPKIKIRILNERSLKILRIL
jgi:predicted nuclease of restriction endonuclease-like RecB superfamily